MTELEVGNLMVKAKLRSMVMGRRIDWGEVRKL